MKTLIFSFILTLIASASLSAQTDETVAMVDKTKNKTEKTSTLASYEVAYPGGTTNLMNYLKENLKYTEQAREYSFEGTLKVKFTINTDGSVGDVQLLNEMEPTLEQHVIKVIEGMPKWRPAVRSGKTIPRKIVLPINFSLM